ncbi:MAG: hypothetical protein ACJ76X_18995 [Solirubrobacteraceae bacterium]
MSDHLFDQFARTLASPISRRRAIGVSVGALVTGSVLRPAAAQAACTQKICSAPGGAFVCVEPDWPCCNSVTCAGACAGSWKVCSQAGTQAASCDDGPALCTDPKSPYAGQKKYKFCYEDVVVQGGICGDRRIKRIGWCCGSGSECGSTNECNCLSGHESCGEKCCGVGETCASFFGVAQFTCMKACAPTHSGVPARPRCGDGNCCTQNEVCGLTGCSCAPGFVSAGVGNCVPPKEDPGDPKPTNNPFLNMWNMMGMSGASHGGGKASDVMAHVSASGSVGIGGALDALAAVSGQGAAAMLAIREGKRDPAFNHRIAVARVKPPRVSAGPGLDATSVAALNRLLGAEAGANALVAAMAKALWRARAAHAKHNRAAAKSQLRASARFAGQAATAFRRVGTLRASAAKTLTSGGVAEVLASDAEVQAFIATVKSHGIPAYLGKPMGKLGVGSTDLQHLRTGVRDQSVTSAAGPVLIAPLQDAGRAKALKSLISELSSFSARARRHPIAR